TPAFRRDRRDVGVIQAPTVASEAERDVDAVPTTVSSGELSGSATKEGRAIAVALSSVAAALARHERELGRLDAVAGDGDHGRGMVKGSAAAAHAAAEAANTGATVVDVLALAGQEWAAQAGGTSGALWGAALEAI